MCVDRSSPRQVVMLTCVRGGVLSNIDINIDIFAKDGSDSCITPCYSAQCVLGDELRAMRMLLGRLDCKR